MDSSKSVDAQLIEAEAETQVALDLFSKVLREDKIVARKALMKEIQQRLLTAAGTVPIELLLH